MPLASRVVIVGASIGGFTTAESLRGAGYEGAITLIGDEPHPPYSRPPLSKQILVREWGPDEAIIRPMRSDLGIELLTGVRATGLDMDRRVVRTEAGAVPFDALVIATGVSARTLNAGVATAGVHTLRTMDDAIALAGDLDGAARALVVGTGILGCEIAAGLSKRGLGVTLAGRNRQIRFGQVGSLLSPLLAGLHRLNGVELRLGVEAVRLLGDDAVAGAVLSDGTEIAADVVVAAVGSIPCTEWLAGAGLRIADGILCDASGRAAPGVYAVGDVARWRDPVLASSTRVEHQQNAIEQAHAVATTIATGRPVVPGIVPFYWSELYGTRIQVSGRFDGTRALEVVSGSTAEGKFAALASRDGVVTGVVGWNMARAFRELRAKHTFSPLITETEFAV